MSIFGDIAGLAGIAQAYSDLGSLGGTIQSKADTLAGKFTGDTGLTAFKPFTVSTGTSTTNVGAQGGLTVAPTGSGAGAQSALFNQLFNRMSDPYGLAQLQQTGSQFLGAAPGILAQQIPGLQQTQQTGQQAYGLANQFMQQAAQGTAGREQDVYNAIRATQLDEENRQRMMLEERLANQGRLGVRTNLYGGTPEQLALDKARAEAQNTAALQAIQQAQAEQAQQGALGAQFAGLGGTLTGQQQALQAAQQAQALQMAQAGMGMLAGGTGLEQAQQQMGLAALQGAYIPEAQALNALQQGLIASQLAQKGQLYGAGLFGEASMTGLDALLASGLGQATLIGNVGSGLLAAGAKSEGDGLFDFISGLFD